MPELIKIIQSAGFKGDLYFCLGYTSMKDPEFTLYEQSKEKNKSYVLYRTYDFQEVLKAIELSKQMGIKRRKDLEAS